MTSFELLREGHLVLVKSDFECARKIHQYRPGQQRMSQKHHERLSAIGCLQVQNSQHPLQVASVINQR